MRVLGSGTTIMLGSHFGCAFSCFVVIPLFRGDVKILMSEKYPKHIHLVHHLGMGQNL